MSEEMNLAAIVLGTLIGAPTGIGIAMWLCSTKRYRLVSYEKVGGRKVLTYTFMRFWTRQAYADEYGLLWYGLPNHESIIMGAEALSALRRKATQS